MLRFLGCVTAILILHCIGKNAILGKLKLTVVYLTGFRRLRKKMELKQLEYFTIVCEKAVSAKRQNVFIHHSPMSAR